MPRTDNVLQALADPRRLLEEWRTAGLDGDVAAMIEDAAARRLALPGQARAEATDNERAAIVHAAAAGEITAGEALARDQALVSANTDRGRKLIRDITRQVVDNLARS